MNTEFAFRQIFNKAASDCYVVEMDLDTNCTNKDPSCKVCAGTGNAIKKIYKVKSIIDSAASGRALVSAKKNTDFGKYYNDGRIIYFLKDCNFNLSPSMSRVVLNIVNGDIEGVFNMQYLEPMVEKNEVIYYEGSLARANMKASTVLNTYRQIIKERRI